MEIFFSIMALSALLALTWKICYKKSRNDKFVATGLVLGLMIGVVIGISIYQFFGFWAIIGALILLVAVAILLPW